MKRLLRSKKAQETEGLPEEPNYTVYFMALAVILPMIVLFAVIGISSSKIEATTIRGNMPTTIVEHRLLNNPECFAYQDKTTKRVEMHTIDLDKFNDERIAECLGAYQRVCVEADLSDGYDVIGTAKTGHFFTTGKVQASVWPVNIKSKDKEVAGMITFRISEGCT